MPALKQASAAALAASIAVVAYAQQPVPADAKAAAATPGATEQRAAPRLPASGRNAFSNTAMPIDIKGEGLALPAGVAPVEELPKPPAATGNAPAPTEK